MGRDVSVFRWLPQKADAKPIVASMPILLSSSDDGFCGVLPCNYPVKASSDLLCDSGGHVKSDFDDIDSLCPSKVPLGSRGVVVRGKPGLPTLYEVRFSVGAM